MSDKTPKNDRKPAVAKTQPEAPCNEHIEAKIISRPPKSAFPDLASISIAAMDNALRSDKSIRVRGVAKFGSTDVMGADSWYKIRIVSCRIDFLIDNARRDPFHTFAHYATKAKVIVKHAAKDNLSSTKSNEQELSSRAEIGSSGLRAALTAKYNKVRKNTSTQSRTNEMVFQPDVAIIQDTPSGIRIGHEIFGDPNKPDQLLEGAYLHDRPNEPLFVAILEEGWAKICARLRVSAGDLRIIDTSSSKRVEPNSPLRNDIDRVMRERIAGIRFLKEFRKDLDGLQGYEIASHVIEIKAE